MAYLGNRAVNLLNLHYGLHAVAMTGGGAFFGAFLLDAGLSVPEALLAIAAICVLRFLLRPLVIPFAVRFGLGPVLIAGTLLQAAQYPLLGEVSGIGAALAGFVVIGALADAVYWTAYHATMARTGDDEARGHQIGAREALATLVSVLSPLLTGWLLAFAGPRAAFGVSAAALALSALPLLRLAPMPVAVRAPGGFREAGTGILIFITDGVLGAVMFAWQVQLYLALDTLPALFGAVLALAALVGAIASLVLAKFIDGGSAKAVLAFGWIFFGGVIGLRLLAGTDPWMAAAANAAGAIANCLYVPVFAAVVYRLAKASPCAVRFHVASEAGWDTGATLSLIASAAAIDAGLSVGWIQMLALPALLGSYLVLRRAS